MEHQLVYVYWYSVFASGVGALDTCWVYDYKYDWSESPYKRMFSCSCGCCGSSWDRNCCPSLPVCHHNSTIPEENKYEDVEKGDDGTEQALILTGIVVGSFCILLALTVFMHLCGRVYMKSQKRSDAPNVSVYNIQETSRNNNEPESGPLTIQGTTNLDVPSTYDTATTVV